MENYTFKNIAGYKNELKELKQLTNILKNYNELKGMGGHLPRGLMLLGDNGVGKTYMARAFIHESGFYCVEIKMNEVNDDNFIDYLDKKFTEAQYHKPSIIFIDELDKMVGERFLSDSSFDRSTALLQLVEKHHDDEDVFLLATANLENEISSSLIRSGRFDKKILVFLPNHSDREEIFKHYLKDKAVSKEITLAKLASDTESCSGADIESIVNDAVINAFNNKRKVINYCDFNKAIADKLFSCVSRESEYQGESLRALAYHEVGHLIVSYDLKGINSIGAISINPRGNIEGHFKRTDNHMNMMTLDEKFDIAAIAMGGRVAEEMFCYDQFTGSASDIARAKAIISSLVKIDGYRGLEYIADRPGPMNDNGCSLSDNNASRLESVIADGLDSAYRKAKKSLRRHATLAAELAIHLIVNKTLNSNEIHKIINEFNEKERNKEEADNNGLMMVNGKYIEDVDEAEYQILKSYLVSIPNVTDDMIYWKFGISGYKVKSFYNRFMFEMDQIKKEKQTDEKKTRKKVQNNESN